MLIQKIVEFVWKKIGSFRRFDPFSIAFCYPIKGEPYIMKGGSREIEVKLEKNKHLVFVNIVYYLRKRHYSYWKFYGLPNDLNVYVSHTYLIHYESKEEMYNYRTGFKIVIKDNKKEMLIKKYRKLPKAFPRAVKEYLTTH